MIPPLDAGAIDWGGSAAAAPPIDAAPSSTAHPAPDATTTPDPDRARPSQATTIVDLVLDAGVVLWHTPTGDPYATIPIEGHREHHALASRTMRDYLARLHHGRTRRTPGSVAITDALAVLGGIARYDGACHDVAVRVAGTPDAMYLDLGGPSWEAVAVTPDGWMIVADPPVRFRRGRALLPLPEPTRGGSIDALRDLIPVREDRDWILIVAWLLGALRPSGPYAGLALDGEQGTGKSTTARLLRGLIDPSAAALRAEPREIRDLMVAASSGWIVALDNLSHVQPWLSDALCRIATGGALSTRQLYTDGDEHLIEAVRPLLLTGITSVVTRGDLQDRMVAITLPAIPEHARRGEADLWQRYERIAPGVLGALLDAVAGALAREATTQIRRLPRMADFAIWVTAAEPALGWPAGTLLRAYAAGRQEVIEQALDGDPLAAAVRAVPRSWQGTAGELLARITPATGRMPRGWPESARALSSALRRLAPQLRRIQIEITWSREAHTGRRILQIEDTGARPSPSSPSSPAPDLWAGSGDGRGDDGDDPRRPSPASSPDPPSISGPGDDGDDGDDVPPTSLYEDDDDADDYRA